MTDETHAALQRAGPDSWHHLIARTRTFPLTDDTTEMAAPSMDSTINCPYSIDAIPAYRTGPATKSPRGANAPQPPLVSSQLCGTHSWV